LLTKFSFFSTVLAGGGDGGGDRLSNASYLVVSADMFVFH
jgi:hypothetical protein